MKPHLVTFLALLLSLNACAVSSSSSSSGSQHRKQKDSVFIKIVGHQSPLIIPGKAIGDVAIGASSASLNQLGPATDGGAATCHYIGIWRYGHNQHYNLTAVSACDPDDDMRPHIQWLRTNDSAFKTASGLGVGSTIEEIKAVFPGMRIPITYQADDGMLMLLHSVKEEGIAFAMTSGKTQVCRAVVLFPKNGSPIPWVTSVFPEMNYTQYKN